jgi:hypothetical protein
MSLWHACVLWAWSRTAQTRTLLGLGGKIPLARPELDPDRDEDGFGVGRPDACGIADMACLASKSG